MKKTPDPRLPVAIGGTPSAPATVATAATIHLIPPGAELGFHPLADLFPLLEDNEFDELVADVHAHEVCEPIWLYEGLILDGRNRYRAAQAAGVDCPARIYEGNDPAGFVVSLNIKRRHLTTSQRAMIAARLATLRQGARTDLSPIGEMSQQQAADILSIGKRSVERATEVRESGDADLIEAVERGDISVSGAVDRIRRGIVTGVAMDPYADRGRDLYETPEPVTRALLAVEALDGTIWECANGRGAIGRVLRAAGNRVVATDIEDYGCADSQSGVDFLQLSTAPNGVTTILTNPPFMHANAFVRQALKLVPRTIMLLRLGFLEGVGRSDLLDEGQLARVYVFRNRLPMLHRDGWNGPIASSAMALAWFVWDRHHHGPTELRRISWEPGDEAPSMRPTAEAAE